MMTLDELTEALVVLGAPDSIFSSHESIIKAGQEYGLLPPLAPKQKGLVFDPIRGDLLLPPKPERMDDENEES